LIRLNRYLAECGVCARRKADVLIEQGVVTVDGRPATVGESVDPERQRVAIRGRPIARPQSQETTLVLNKPAGVITTLRDEHGRKSVASLLPSSPRLFPVGRLDADSTGVLLFTNDGDLARVLTHPSFSVEKIYRVRAGGEMTPQTRSALRATNVRSRADGSHSFDIALHEGRNRQVRRMCAQRGLRVLELTRVKFGPVALGALLPGKMRPLTAAEKAALARIRSAATAQLKTQKRAPVRPTE
jgi:23S rRNA pseudouridine2605 synthase